MPIIQLTGLSGAGKTTIANQVKKQLELDGISVEIIDGDVYRRTLCRDLGFSKADRCENIRRLGSVAAQTAKHNQVVIISAINPYDEVRQELKELYGAKIVYIECDLDTLFIRDTKGLYRRTKLNDDDPDKVHNLTGVNDTYEIPGNADLVIRTDRMGVEESVEVVIGFMVRGMK